MRPTFVSLFAGVGGFDLALERAGFRCVGQVEIDPGCQRVLGIRWPDVPRWGDVRDVGIRGPVCGAGEFDGADAAGDAFNAPGRQPVDLLVGGFPCQDLSVAGKRAGLAGERSGLFWEIIRVAKVLKPAWGIFENVPGLLSSHRGRDMAVVLEGLRECWPAVGYRVLDSRYFGVAQRRRRVFFVCGPDEARVASVLFEPESGGGHPAAREEAGARVATSLTSGSHRAGVNEPGRRNEDDVNLVIARAIANGTNAQRFDGDTENFVIAATLNADGNNGGFRTEPGEHLVTHTLKAEGHDASEDGTGRGVPLCIQDARDIAKDQNGLGVSDEGVSYTLDGAATQAVAFQSSQSGVREVNAHATLDANNGSRRHNGVTQGMVVRRLTPMEFERLQGFPDGWTCLCLPLDEWARDPEDAAERCSCPDSPRYRQMGNAVTRNVVEWIGRRLGTARA